MVFIRIYDKFHKKKYDKIKNLDLLFFYEFYPGIEKKISIKQSKIIIFEIF